MLTRIKRIKFADEEQYVVEYCIDANEWNFIINEDNDFPKYFNNVEIAKDYAQQFENIIFLLVVLIIHVDIMLILKKKLK